MKKVSWDTDRARALLEEGKTDIEIADMVGTTVASFRSWKARAGLTTKRPPKKPSEAPGAAPAQDDREPAPAPIPATAPTVAPPAGPQALPGGDLPVTVSFSYDGAEVTLTAPNLGRALWAGRYLQQLLSDLETTLQSLR